MKTFAIVEDNNITAYGSKKEAAEAGGAMFASKEELAAALEGSLQTRLADIWNRIQGVELVKRSEERGIALGRMPSGASLDFVSGEFSIEIAELPSYPQQYPPPLDTPPPTASRPGYVACRSYGVTSAMRLRCGPAEHGGYAQWYA